MQHYPLVSKICVLEKFPGKGGWTYAAFPEIHPNKQNPFGWVRVNGTIDGYPIKRYHLMPLGNGALFLPVKAEIRKKIKKQVGDRIELILFPDVDQLEIPEEFLTCLKDEPTALKNFHLLSETDQEKWIKWIYAPKSAMLQIKRISHAIQELIERKKVHE